MFGYSSVMGKQPCERQLGCGAGHELVSSLLGESVCCRATPQQLLHTRPSIMGCLERKHEYSFKVERHY